MKYIILLLLFISASTQAQNVEKLQDLALEQYNKRKYLDAQTTIKKAIDKKPRDIDNRLIYSQILLGLDKVNEAEAQLLAILLIDKENAETYNRLATIYVSLNDLETGIEMYQKAIEYEPEDSIKFLYFNNMAASKGLLGKVNEAIEDLEKAYKIDPNNPALQEENQINSKDKR